jgi:hypothetical protein
MEKIQTPIGTSPAPVVVVGHFDVHGVTATFLAAKAFGASDVYCSYPQTGPETLIGTLQNLYSAAPSRLRIIVVDVPVNLKDPFSFIAGLESLAQRHEILFFDHHETSLPYLAQFRNVKAFYVGPSALTLNETLLRMIPDPSEIDRTIAIVGAIADRDPDVVRRNLLSPELIAYSDGMDVLVRESAQNTVKALITDPVNTLERARERANQIPTARLAKRVGPVAVSDEQLPPQWGPKSLERMAFASGSWYAVGWGIDERTKQVLVRAIARWDVVAKMPYLPLPGNVAKSLWPFRNVIGHPAAPSIAAATVDEAKQMVDQLAQAIAQAATKSAAPQVATLISESKVGEALVEIMQRLEQILEEQKKMYSEYLELKRQQVELLKRTGGARAAD